MEELKLPDVTVLAEIYAAREQNDIGISSQDLAREIPGAIYCSSLEKVTDTLASLAQPGDLILTVGPEIFSGPGKSCGKERESMNVSPVYHGAPAESRTPVEDRTYAALEELGIPLTGWITIRRRTWRTAPSSLRRWGRTSARICC